MEVFEEKDKDCLHPLSEEMISLVNRIVDETGCTVILSSAWRSLGLDHVQELLDKHGATFKLAGETPSLAGCRGEEIISWMADNKVHDGQIAILDDDADMDALLPRLVQTQWQFGLKPEHAQKVIEMLNVD
jgi:hypothetical protein